MWTFPWNKEVMFKCYLKNHKSYLWNGHMNDKRILSSLQIHLSLPPSCVCFLHVISIFGDVKIFEGYFPNNIPEIFQLHQSMQNVYLWYWLKFCCILKCRLIPLFFSFLFLFFLLQNLTTIYLNYFHCKQYRHDSEMLSSLLEKLQQMSLIILIKTKIYEELSFSLKNPNV